MKQRILSVYCFIVTILLPFVVNKAYQNNDRPPSWTFLRWLSLRATPN